MRYNYIFTVEFPCLDLTDSYLQFRLSLRWITITKVNFDFLQIIKRNFIFKIKGGFTFTFVGAEKPRIMKQTSGERQNRKIAFKGKVNQINLLWGSASKHNRTLLYMYEATFCGVLKYLYQLPSCSYQTLLPLTIMSFAKRGGGGGKALGEKFYFFLVLVI